MLDEYNGVEFEVSATSGGVAGPWTGEVAIYKKTSCGDRVKRVEMAPGKFTSEGDAREAARAYAKQLIDHGLSHGASD